MSRAHQTASASRAKVMLLITEDWFLLSHFQPLVRALVGEFGDVVVVTTSSGRLLEIEALGARTIAFDFDRASMHPVRQARIVQQLRALIRRERPDVVHAIALKAIALGGVAFRSVDVEGRRPRFVMHLTGSGPVGSLASGQVPVAYAMTLRLMKWLLRRTDTELLVENTDDAARVGGAAWFSHGRVTVVGGAGVDPDAFAPAPFAPHTPPRIGFLGRMLSTKGVGVLVEAHQRLLSMGVPADLHLGGDPDPANRWAIPAATLDGWQRLPHVYRHGRIDDAGAFWRAVDIAVVPSRWGEGMPRVLLEAAATARPVIVTDVPGCRHFVRHEQEGLVVPPDDTAALAEALRRLTGDPVLAARLGQAARARLVGGFTERHVAEAVIAAYMRLLQHRAH